MTGHSFDDQNCPDDKRHQGHVWREQHPEFDDDGGIRWLFWWCDGVSE